MRIKIIEYDEVNGLFECTDEMGWDLLLDLKPNISGLDDPKVAKELVGKQIKISHLLPRNVFGAADVVVLG